MRPTRPMIENRRLAKMSLALSQALQDMNRIIVTVYNPGGDERILVVPRNIVQTSNMLIGWDPINELPVNVEISDIVDIELI